MIKSTLLLKYKKKGEKNMFKINSEEIEKLTGRMAELIECKPELLAGFACSASDNSCGCGWDCSSTKT